MLNKKGSRVLPYIQATPPVGLPRHNNNKLPTRTKRSTRSARVPRAPRPRPAKRAESANQFGPRPDLMVHTRWQCPRAIMPTPNTCRSRTDQHNGRDNGPAPVPVGNSAKPQAENGNLTLHINKHQYSPLQDNHDPTTTVWDVVVFVGLGSGGPSLWVGWW